MHVVMEETFFTPTSPGHVVLHGPSPAAAGSHSGFHGDTRADASLYER